MEKNWKENWKKDRKKRILLLDMYGVIIKESKGYFIQYTFEHFDKKEHNRLTRALCGTRGRNQYDFVQQGS